MAADPTSDVIIICRTRLANIIKLLQDDFVKWQQQQKRGTSLCNSIESIKTRTLEAASQATVAATLYPKELKPYCDRLAIITSVFKDITANAHASLKQLRALARLPGSSEEIFYRTWKINQFVQFADQLVASYDKETQVKQRVMQEMPHCLTRAELIRCASAWEYPQHVDESLTLMFAFLAEEVNVKKK